MKTYFKQLTKLIVNLYTVKKLFAKFCQFFQKLVKFCQFFVRFESNKYMEMYAFFTFFGNIIFSQF